MVPDEQPTIASVPAPAAAESAPSAAGAPKEVAPWKSKTMIASAIVGILPLIPGVGPVLTGIVTANPQIALLAVGGIFAGLRWVTHGKITLPK